MKGLWINTKMLGCAKSVFLAASIVEDYPPKF